MQYVVILMLTALACLNLNMAQAAYVFQRESLKGLPEEISVIIEKIQSDAQADGLSQDAIRTAVEVILRSSGLRVVPAAEAFLTVNVGTIKEASMPLYSCSVRVTLYQQVRFMHRPQDETYYASTWNSGSVAYFSPSRISEVVNIVEGHVKEFANDFLAVNPR